MLSGGDVTAASRPHNVLSPCALYMDWPLARRVHPPIPSLPLPSHLSQHLAAAAAAATVDALIVIRITST